MYYQPRHIAQSYLNVPKYSIAAPLLTESIPLYRSSQKPYVKLQEKEYNDYTISTQHIHAPFLSNTRPVSNFALDHQQVKDLTEETFFKLTGKPLPNNIIISILNSKEFHKRHSLEGILGSAVNRNLWFDFNSIFIKENPLDIMILTIGHEIGHVLSITKQDPVLEEAKAFAFELAWMQTIFEFDIGGLAQNMNMQLINPAMNGLHNVALDFVLSHMRQGKTALGVFESIINNELKLFT